MRDPSGDHVGNPYRPSAVSPRRIDLPSAPTTEIEPSFASTAIEPEETIGPAAVDALGASLGAMLPAGDEVTAEGTALGDGAVLPHAAARNAETATATTGLRRAVIR
jgi:hypothetical protein